MTNTTPAQPPSYGTPPPTSAAPTTAPPHPNAISIGDRITAAVVSLACLALLATAAFLTPAPEGHGTHQALGMPACGIAATFDLPCFTCGMTTAFAHATRGQFLAAAKTQPFGALLSILAASAVWTAAYAACTGSHVWTALTRLAVHRGISTGIALLIAAWVYKIITW